MREDSWNWGQRVDDSEIFKPRTKAKAPKPCPTRLAVGDVVKVKAQSGYDKYDGFATVVSADYHDSINYALIKLDQSIGPWSSFIWAGRGWTGSAFEPFLQRVRLAIVRDADNVPA